MATERTWSVRGVLEAAERVADGRELGPSRSEIASCLADVLATDRMQLLLDHDRPLSKSERGEFRRRLERLLTGEPPAYVRGAQEFYGRPFRVDRRVLIPRPETERLVELAIERIPENGTAFEPCTGSGCVGITIALERRDVRVSASDITADALALARENARALGARVGFAHGSYWEPAAGRRFGALIANPPYVDPDRTEFLEERVRRFEPAVAVFAPRGTPLEPYDRLLAGGIDGLESGAPVLCEVGLDTGEPAKQLAQGYAEYTGVELIEDLSGIPRVLCCRRR